MDGHIRVLGTLPKVRNGIPDASLKDVLSVAFFFPINAPESLQDTLAAKVAAVSVAKGVLTPAEPVAVDPAWKAIPTAVAYNQAGGTRPASVDQVSAEVAAVLTPEDKIAIEAGEVTIPTMVQVALDNGETLADLLDTNSTLFKTINLMWNQAFKNFTDHFAADRARYAAPEFGMVLNEVVIEDLANIPKELQP